MTDQCKNCQVRGDLNTCLVTQCFHHENWYAVEQQKKIDVYRAALQRVIELPADQHNCIALAAIDTFE